MLLSFLRALLGIFGFSRGASTTPAGGGATPVGGGATGPATGGGTASTIPPPPNQPPRIRWTSAIASPSGVPVPLRYTLEDDESDPIRIEVEYSLDGGATFHPATEDDAVATDGTAALSSDPGGVDHVFGWHAKQDLNGRAASGVIVRVQAFDANPGATITSAPFDVDARVVAMPSRPWAHPFGPTLTGQNVPVRFVVGDRDGQPVRVVVEYKKGTSAWTPATPSVASDALDFLPAPDLEADYRFIWDAGHDLPNQSGSVNLRFTSLKGNLAGPPTATGAFSFDTTIPAPAASVFTPPPARTPTIDIVGTNPIEGVPGKLLPEVLRVRVVDSSGQPLAGMRVSFTQGANSIPLELESDRDLWEVTDGLGQAAIRVRIAAGAIGAGEVVVQLPGFPAHKKSLRITSKAPVIYHNNLPAMPLIHGQQYSITVGYGDPNTPAWLVDPFSPLRLKVEGVNALVSHAVLPIPENPQQTGTARILTFVPLFDSAAAGPPPTPGSTTTTSATTTAGKLRVSDLADPTVFVDIPFTVASPTSSRRTGRFSRAPYPTRVVPNAGVPGTQVGYPGLTLKQTFQVHLTDGAHTFQGAQSNFTGCTVTAQPMTLPIEWIASNGLLSTQSTPPATAGNRLRADVATPVHFTPVGAGPWYVSAYVSDSVIDPHPVTITYMSGTTNVCERENAFGVNSSFSFIVQEPTDVKVMPAQPPAPGAPAPMALDAFRAGDTWRLEIAGLSEYEAGGQPAALRATSTLAPGGSIPAYTGYPYPFDQPLAVTPNAARNGLTSASLTIVRGEPATVVPNAHAVIPGAWLRIHGDAVEHSLPVPGRPHRRLVTNGAESLEETPAGTSPAAGAFNSVLLHNGEFVYRAHCISVTDRPRMLSISRTHRSHARTDGPLGPGWELEHCGGLDVSRSRGMRWFTGLGRTIDFPALAPPPGVFVELRTNLAITADQSPYEIRDTHGNWMHFHVDGSPRFLKDLNDNRTRYEYNAQGQLTTIKGVWDNSFTLTYWKKGDPVDEEIYGRLRSITDRITREVSFEYYPHGSTTGGLPGWLKTVQHSKPLLGKTLVDGQEVDDFRAPETYLYEINPRDPLEARVKQILDWHSDVRIENKHDGFRRVEKQTTDAKGAYDFAYDPTRRATTFSDRKQRTTLFEFADTPFANAAAPSSITQQRDAALHPGAPNLVTTFTHMPWGARASITHAAGIVEEFWYDERSPFPRSRGNLLKHRVRAAAGGAERLSVFEYDDRFNVVHNFYAPRAFAAGENPKAYLTQYNHDAQGRVTKIISPRTMHAIIQPVGTRRRVLWIDDEPSQEYSYNGFGLVKEHIDEQGVVTEYKYWDAANPYGLTLTGPTSPDAGGMLAIATRDTRQTGDRSLYLPGVPVASMQTTFAYNELGDRIASANPLRKQTFTAQNGLHQVIDVEQVAALANPARRAQMWDEFGNLAQIEITLPQTAARPGGKLTDRTFWNRAERKWEHHLIFQPFTPAGAPSPPPAAVFKETLTVDEDDQPTAFFDAQANTAATPVASLGLAGDERGMLAEVRNGGSAALATKIHSHAAGDIGEVKLPGNRTLGALRGPLAEPAGLVEADGLRHEQLHDTGGMPTRELTEVPANTATTPPTPAKTLGFSEDKVDEWNRWRRSNLGFFEAGPAAGAPQPVPEYFPPAPIQWPPDAGSALADGGWGPGDGRATYDTVFDPSGRVVRACDDDLGMSWTRYDAHGRPIEWSDSREEFDPYFNITTAAYDMTARTADRTHSVHSSDRTQPRTQSFLERDELDGLGRTVRALNGAGDAVRYVYDERDQVVEIYDAAGRDSAETYNGAAINERGNLTAIEYDEAGRITKIETSLTEGGLGGRPPENNPYNTTQKTRVVYTYDRAGRFTGHQDWSGMLTTRRYDALGRLWQIAYSPSAASGSGPATHTMTFDAQSRIETATDANGTRIKLEYDALDRVAERKLEAPANLAGAKRLRSEYDDAGLLHVAEQYPDTQPGTAPSWRSVFVYDSAGHVLTATENGRPIVSEYAGNRRRVLRYPGGAVVRFEYDVNGRLRSVDDNGAVLTLHYLGESLPDSWTFNGVTARYAYDNAARAESITISGFAQGALRFGLEYTDRTGRICVRTRQLGAGATETRLYGYDSAGRLTRDNAQPFPASAHTDTQMKLWLDGDGVVRKRETKFIGGPATPARVDEFEREERGRVIRKNGAPLIYDKNGNLLSDGAQQYVYDAFDRLITVMRNTTAGMTIVCSYEYDALHRLVKRTAGSVVQEYVYDSSNPIEIRSGSQVDRFVYADEDSRLLLAEIGGQRYLVITSPEGSVDSLVDAQRRIVESYEYSAKGDVIRLDAARQPLAGTPLCPFLHKQQLFDPASGLIRYHLRWYSPELGVFLAPDPAGIAQGTNAYTLCRGDPINGHDPTGALDIAGEEWDIPSWGDITKTFSFKNFSIWQGIKGGAGAVKALGVAALQLGLTAWDVGTHIGASIGGYRFKSVSALGQLYDASPTLGDFFWNAGKGIVQTPLRMLQAGAQGNAIGFGEEAMNIYILGRGKALARRLDQGIGALGRGFNRFVGTRTSRFGVFARNVIRNAQVQMARVEATLAMLRRGRNPLPLWRGRWRYAEDCAFDPGAYGANVAGNVFIYERSFNPPPNWLEPLEANGILDALGEEGAAALREQGFSARGTAVHEGFHSYQRATAPAWWEARIGNRPFYAFDAAEFTQPGGGAPFPGAWNFQLANPPLPGWKISVPMTGMYIGSRRRR